MDGLRAFAALSIVAYHLLLFQHFYRSPLGRDFVPVVFFLQTGVHLFFVLSGFLLFLPYARAIIKQTPLPSPSHFYRRRALRILPVYWLCLAILALADNLGYSGVLGFQDFITHIFLLHDAFPPFNRDIEGPFWTLAVEAQFYVLLPLFARGAASYVGPASGIIGRLRRLAVAVAGILGLALLLRLFDILLLRRFDIAVTGQLTASHGTFGVIGQIFVLATMGTQGKYLEVFAVGMLCSILYVAAVELRLLDRRHMGRLSWLALAGAIVTAIYADQEIDMTVPLVYARGVKWDIVPLCLPLVIGVAYGLLLLAALWSGGLVRAVFEIKALRFIGLISYSVYLWHWPIIYAKLPLVASVPLAGRVVLVFLVAYGSFQLVERPFLRRRDRSTSVGERPHTLEVATSLESHTPYHRSPGSLRNAVLDER